jgi:hypothetical protein
VRRGDMAGVGGRHNEAIHPSFDRSIPIDFKGAKIISDTGLLLMRQVDEGAPLTQGERSAAIKKTKPNCSINCVDFR